MTREEQLKEYLKERNIPVDSLEANLIKEGIDWADENPSSSCYTKRQLREMGFAFTTNDDIVTPDDMRNIAERYFEYRKKELCRELYKWIKAKVDANYTATDILRDFEWSFHEVMEE